MMHSSNSNLTGNSTARSNSVENVVRSIPSAAMTPERYIEERKLSMELKARKSAISRLYAQKRSTSIASVGSTKESKLNKEPQIQGKASLRLCSELDVDQLCCHYNEDFSLYATGGVDGIVRIYETTYGKLVRSILGGKETDGCTSCVTSIKHRPIRKSESVDHQFTITYVNGIVKCFNYNTTECKFTIDERRQTYGLAFHPRLPKFITYGDDMKINLYDYETKMKERKFQKSDIYNKHDGHTSRVFAAKFNPASNTEFLSGGWDNTVLLWDLRQPHAARIISNVNLCGEGLDIDERGKKVLTCSWRKVDQLQLWDYSTFKLISSDRADTFDSKLSCGRFLGSDSIACGGSDPASFRVVDLLHQKLKVVITDLAADVIHLDVRNYGYGTDCPTNVKRDTSRIDDQPHSTKAPTVLFTAGGRIYHVDFSI